jgi:nucleoside 2-deoxyribosyltransferase
VASRPHDLPDQPPVYVASPLGFSEPGRRYNVSVIAALTESGIKANDPWAMPNNPVGAALELPASPERVAVLQRANAEVGLYNERLIRESIAMLAILDGSDVDSGTAAEIGFAAALKIPVVGLRTDTRVTGDNDGAAVNLQVERFIYRSGGTITRSLPEAIAALLAVLRSRRGSPGTEARP